MESHPNCAQCNNSSGKMSAKKFNQMFDNTMEMQKQINQKNDQYRLSVLSQEANYQLINKPILQYTIDDYSSGYGTNMSEMMEELVNNKFQVSILTKDNRIFFIGITILIIAVGALILHILL